MNAKLINRYFKVFTSYVLGFPVYAPDSVSIIVSDSCNLRCAMCDFWRDNKKVYTGLTSEEYQSLFKDLHNFGVRMVQLTGGEPFLRSDLNDILRIARENALKTAVVTNATLITEKNVEKFASNVDLVYVSLDSPSKSQHEAIRGSCGIFEKIIKSLTLLINTIKANSLAIPVILCATITPESIHQPEEMVDLAKRLGVNGIIYNPASSVHYGNTTLRSTFAQENISNGAYSKMVDKIIALMTDPKNLIRSNPFYLAASKEIIKGNGRYYKFRCLGGGYNGPLIGFDGTVFPCCAWNMPLGNIKEQFFSRIWKSAKAKQARKSIKKGECPVCYHHTRTFDFIVQAPTLFKDIKMLYKGFRILSRM